MTIKVNPSDIIVMGDSDKVISSIAETIKCDFKFKNVETKMFEEFMTWELPKQIMKTITEIERTQDAEMRVLIPTGKIILSTLYFTWKRLKVGEVLEDMIST